MTDVVLTLNAGSSSLKYALYSMGGDSPLASGMVDAIGSPKACLTLVNSSGDALPVQQGSLSTHGAAMETVLENLAAAVPSMDVCAVGHRVVHGGINYEGPVLVSESVLSELERLSPFAPLHQPHNIAGIRAAMQSFPDAPQIACFDTAFHRTHPWVNDTFALPREFYEEGVRRYGFHGLSYDYISGELLRFAPLIGAGRVVVAHLGNGASMCAIQNGRSVASTMGFSALDGLPMGTRSGQLDPGVLLYLMDQKGLSTAEIIDLLYKKSGLLGLSGLSNDMRTLEASDKPEAREAIDYFVFRIQRELGAMAAAMGGLDALVFTGGIGENSRLIRERVCARTEWIGLELDHAKNAENARIISTEISRARIMVIPTNEGLVIARATRAHLNGES